MAVTTPTAPLQSDAAVEAVAEAAVLLTRPATALRSSALAPVLRVPLTSIIAATKTTLATVAHTGLADMRTTPTMATADMAAPGTTTMMNARTGASTETVQIGGVDDLTTDLNLIWGTPQKMRRGRRK